MSLGPVMIGIEGHELSPDEEDLLRHFQLGGVILFARNYASPEQLAALTGRIHALRDPPLLVAVDQEGGRVQRFRNGFTVLPPVARLGRLHDESAASARHLAEQTGWLMAAELLSVGVDFSFAPVLDLDRNISSVIGDRAFSRDPRVVADLAHHYVRGMKRAGMAATAKHFPGHGSVREDSHHELPIDPRPFEELSDEDLLPFEQLVADGIEAVMASHVLYDRIDAQPAGYSRFWLQEVLRERLDFQGVIFSDDLLMEAASVGGDLPGRARRALHAGCDMVLICRGLEDAGKVADALGEWSRPASRLRLARMHGRRTLSRDELQTSSEWREAVTKISGYDEEQTIELL